MKTLTLTNYNQLVYYDDDKNEERIKLLDTKWCLHFRKDGKPEGIWSTRSLGKYKRRQINLARFIMNVHDKSSHI